MSTTRRGFLKGTTAGAGVAAASLCTGCSVFLKRATPDLRFPGGTEVVRVSLAEHPVLADSHGVAHLVSEDERIRVVVIRDAAGALIALSMECTHWGSDVRYRPDEGRLVCPSHGSAFDLQGQVVDGPADEPLRRYPVAERDGVIEVTLS